MLTAEIERAVVVTPQGIPPDVVTMNSEVCIRGSANGELVTYTLVFPWNSDLSKNEITVLALIGTALLGEPQGNVIRVATPGGMREFQIEKIEYQPEAEGLAA